MTSRLRSSVAANVLGRSFSAILAILFTPAYIHFLGIEAYGIVGFYMTLMASVSFLEMGLSRACNRELARFAAEPFGRAKQMGELLRTLEILYAVVAIVIGVCLVASVNWISSNWLNATGVARQDIHTALILTGVVIALRWPIGLYVGAMMGLQRQVSLNVILAILAATNWAGSALVMGVVGADLRTFFYWQLLVAIVSSATLAVLAWRAMPTSPYPPKFSLRALREIAPFAAGLGLNTVLGTLLLQSDKLLVSALLPMKEFGYYVLASTMVSAIALIANSVSNAAFPRFSQMVGALASVQEISGIYHLVCQAITLLIMPVAMMMSFFANEVLYVYTGNAAIAEETAAALSILSLAKLLHSSMVAPYALQLAFGWVKVPLYTNLASLLWMLPGAYWLTQHYGLSGAAYAWLVVAGGYVLIMLPIMHRQLLPGGWRVWALEDFGKPLVVVVLLLGLAKTIFTDMSLGRFETLAILTSLWLIASILALMSMRGLRNIMSDLIYGKPHSIEK